MANPLRRQFGDDPALGRLIAEAREGNAGALGELLQSYREYLLLVAHAELPTRLRVKLAPSDIVQETFVEAHRDFRRFRGCTGTDLRSWLRRALLNNLRDLAWQFLGSGKRQLSREVAWGGEIQAAAIRSADSPEATAELHDVLESLPAVYRQVIVLRGIERRAFVEIGALMGRTPEAARKLWSRAASALEARLGDDGPHEESQ
jgi:RNA polymerase sigma-70 factor (ECF subfamily)